MGRQIILYLLWIRHFIHGIFQAIKQVLLSTYYLCFKVRKLKKICFLSEVIKLVSLTIPKWTLILFYLLPQTPLHQTPSGLCRFLAQQSPAPIPNEITGFQLFFTLSWSCLTPRNLPNCFSFLSTWSVGPGARQVGSKCCWPTVSSGAFAILAPGQLNDLGSG